MEETKSKDSIIKRNSVKANYDKIAKFYSDDFGTYIEDLDIYAEFEQYLKPGATILDLGAGSGRTYAYFNRKGYKYTALDFSQKMKNYAFKIHGEFPYIVDDIMNVKNHFNDNSLDAVFAVYSLFHLSREDFERVITDIYDILKKDGMFLMSFQIGKGEKFVDEPYLKEKGKSVLFMNYFSKQEVYNILQRNNFELLYEKEKHEEGDGIIGENGNDAVYVILRKKEE